MSTGRLEVTGTLSITAQRSWLLDVQVAPRPGDAPKDWRQPGSTCSGPPDGNGRYPLRVEGTFK